MLPLTSKDIQESFVNVSLRERKNIPLPADFDKLAWDKLDYLGWRDAKSPNLGYVVVQLDGTPVGILLRQVEGKSAKRAQCSWCEDVQLPNDVVSFSAKRAGPAGRNGNTVATLICAEFECSANVRKQPVVAYVGFDVEAARTRRIDVLREHARNFVANVADGD